MEKPQPFYVPFKERMYYNNIDLFNHNKMFYVGFITKPKTIVDEKRKNIPLSEYLYANLNKGEWKLSDIKCKKSQLLISEEWVDEYYFKTEIGEKKTTKKPVDRPKK